MNYYWLPINLWIAFEGSTKTRSVRRASTSATYSNWTIKQSPPMSSQGHQWITPSTTTTNMHRVNITTPRTTPKFSHLHCHPSRMIFPFIVQRSDRRQPRTMEIFIFLPSQRWVEIPMQRRRWFHPIGFSWMTSTITVSVRKYIFTCLNESHNFKCHFSALLRASVSG